MATEEFTRGGMEANRGESMVQKHAEKIQQEKETKAMEKVGALMPQIGRLVHALALKECSWDVERALILLRQFHADNSDKLEALRKKHKKQLKQALQELAEASDPTVSGAGKRGADKEAGGQREAAGEASSSGSESDGSSSGGDDSGSGSESEGERGRSSRHKSKKSKSKSKEKRSKRSKDKDKKSSKKRKRDKDRERRDSSPAGKAAKLTHGDSFGKYGILRETDYFAKRSEFMRWALDEKKIDVDLMPKNEERELFREYMEDYNTGTLPHKKYYDLEAYERYKVARAAKKGREAAEAASKAKKRSGGMEFNDEKELAQQRAEARAKAQQERLQEAFKELQGSSKAQDMREQELLRMQANLAYKTGDTATAQKLMERLKPDDKREDGKA